MKRFADRKAAGSVAIALLLSLAGGDSLEAKTGRLPADFIEKRFSVNFRNTDLKNVLRLIGEQGGVTFQIDESVSGSVSHSFTNTTLADALDEVVNLNGLSYYDDNGVIYIQKDGGAVATTSSGSAKVHKIKIRNAVAQNVVEKVPKNFMKAGESLIIDDSSNTVVFHGSEPSYLKLTEFISHFDTVPIQIVIEAQIIETTKNFVQDIGFKWGLGAIQADTGLPTPNLTAKLLLGTVGGTNLDVNLAAAESTGDAKIISRPKIVTLNNQAAVIHSGVTFNVKTLSSQTSTTDGGGGGTTTPPAQGTLTGGLQQVTAGLQLNVHPLAVGTDFVRLKINVTNSEPDNGLAVDGIPGIVDNSAGTSIIVRDGNTAVMAGLIKSSISNASNSVPWLSRIPVLGWLFSSHSEKDRRTELVILITPRIITLPMDLPGKIEPVSTKETSKQISQQTLQKSN